MKFPFWSMSHISIDIPDNSGPGRDRQHRVVDPWGISDDLSTGKSLGKSKGGNQWKTMVFTIKYGKYMVNMGGSG